MAAVLIKSSMIWDSAGFLPRLSKDFSLSFSRFSFAVGLRYKLILTRLRPRPATLRFGEEAGMPARLSLKSELIYRTVSSFSYNIIFPNSSHCRSLVVACHSPGIVQKPHQRRGRPLSANEALLEFKRDCKRYSAARPKLLEKGPVRACQVSDRWRSLFFRACRSSRACS